MDVWVDGLGRCPRADCRDAGEFITAPILELSKATNPGCEELWNMLQGSKLNRLSPSLATRTSWVALFTFERFVGSTSGQGGDLLKWDSGP